jgi:hypothetical protein
MNRLSRRLWCSDPRLVAACCLVTAAGLVQHARAAEGPAADEALSTSEQAEVPLQLGLQAERRAPARPAATLEVDSRRQVVPAAAEDRMRVRVVRWSDTPEAAAVGVSLGVGVRQVTPALPAQAQRPISQMSPELGVRFRTGWRQDRRVDVDAWRSYERPAAGTATEPGPSNNARVELQFRQPKDANGLDVPRGAVGIQTSANSQWVLRAKRGGPMVYYRARW